jgi:hypothetical protein
MKMTHYGFSKRFFERQDKLTLIEWGKMLNNILLSMGYAPPDWEKDKVKRIEKMTKSGLIEYCYYTIDDIFDYDVGTHSFFFWHDGGSDVVYESLCDTIGETGKLVDDFVRSDYLDSIWKYKIQGYKLEVISLNFNIDYPDFYCEDFTDQILLEWKKYKSSHENVDYLFD